MCVAYVQMWCRLNIKRVACGLDTYRVVPQSKSHSWTASDRQRRPRRTPPPRRSRPGRTSGGRAKPDFDGLGAAYEKKTRFARAWQAPLRPSCRSHAARHARPPCTACRERATHPPIPSWPEAPARETADNGLPPRDRSTSMCRSLETVFAVGSSTPSGLWFRAAGPTRARAARVHRGLGPRDASITGRGGLRRGVRLCARSGPRGTTVRPAPPVCRLCSEIRRKKG